MTRINYLTFAQFKQAYPTLNYSSRVVVDLLEDFPRYTGVPGLPGVPGTPTTPTTPTNPGGSTPPPANLLIMTDGSDDPLLDEHNTPISA
jgi:hypothetical protein